MRRRTVVWAALLAAVLFVSAVLTSKSDTSAKSRADFGRTPVLFVHGHGLGPNDWDELAAHLRSQGYPNAYLYAVEIQPNKLGNIEAAQRFVARAADKLLAAAGDAARVAEHAGMAPDQLDIVAHSMGAVSSRWYVAKVSPERVRTWVGIAGANHGTNSLCDYDDDGAIEMCPAFARSANDSAVQIALNGSEDAPLDETPYGLGPDRSEVPTVAPDGKRNILYFTIRIEPDKWITPSRSAVLDGAGGLDVTLAPGMPVHQSSPGNFLILEGEGHCSLLYDPWVLKLVSAMLSLRDRDEL